MFTRLPSSSLRVSGPDRVDFVQGQMTNDIRGAATPGMVACGFLNVRGQLEQFARVYKRPDDLYLHLDAGQAPALLARFKKYIIFDQVEVQDTSEQLATAHLWNPEQVPGWQPDGADVQQFEVKLASGATATLLAARVIRTGQSGLDLHYLRQHEAEILELFGEEKSLAELDAARIEAGIPDPQRDGFIGVLPQEIGLDIRGPLPAISYRKGCYVGQEIMARLEARGNARYQLARLRGEHLPAHGEAVQNGKTVGQAGLSSGTAVLARLRKEIPAAAEVTLGGHTAQVEWLDG